MKIKMLMLLVVVMGLMGCGLVNGRGIGSGADLVKHIDTSTVALMIEIEDEHSFRVYCTGVWVSETEILTAHHCVQAAANAAAGVGEDEDVDVVGAKIYYIEKNEVMGYKRDPSALHWAKVEKADKLHDLALVRAVGAAIPGHDIAKIASSVPNRGDGVHIVGHVTGLFWTYIEGVVAGYRSDLYMEKGGPFLQLSAPVYFGNSGGGVFNNDGELVGIVSFMMRAPLTNFAIPVDSINRFMKS